MPSAASRFGGAPPFILCPPRGQHCTFFPPRGEAGPPHSPAGLVWNRRPKAVPLPFEESETRPEAPRFSFLRFPQSKRLWIPLLTLLDNLLLTVGHHLTSPRPSKDTPAAKHSPAHIWGSEEDPVMRRTNLSVYALER